jgi:two-component system cell cycle response regulator
VPVFWLCYSVGDKRIHPKRLGILGREIARFTQENQQGVVLLDGLEYLIVNNDFNKVIKTIHSMCEVVMQNSSRLIIPVNPEILNEKELALLERNLEVIKLRTAPEPGE